MRCGEWARRIDGRIAFVICSRTGGPTKTLKDRPPGRMIMTRFSTKTLLMAAALSALATSAFAQAAEPTPWVLTPDMGYGYDKEGKTCSYKIGTNNAGLRLTGGEQVPKGTLFLSGHTRQRYLRPGPYLEGDGTLMFGPN